MHDLLVTAILRVDISFPGWVKLNFEIKILERHFFRNALGLHCLPTSSLTTPMRLFIDSQTLHYQYTTYHFILNCMSIINFNYMYGHVFIAVKCIKKIEHRITVVGIDEILSSFVSSSFRFSLFGKEPFKLT